MYLYNTIFLGRKGRNLSNEEAGKDGQEQRGGSHAAEAECDRREDVEPAGAVSGTDARLPERVRLHPATQLLCFQLLILFRVQ